MQIHAHLSRVLVAAAVAGLSACASAPPATLATGAATLSGTQ
jgi:type IV pilus biogenesis protein CpaD/CtpE